MKPMIHEIMAAGPAIEDASHAPNNQPEPINEPSPSKTSCERLILLLYDLILFSIITPSYVLKDFSTNYWYNYTRV